MYILRKEAINMLWNLFKPYFLSNRAFFYEPVTKICAVDERGGVPLSMAWTRKW